VACRSRRSTPEARERGSRSGSDRLASGTIGAAAMPRPVVALLALVLFASPALGQTPAPGPPAPPSMRLDYTGAPSCAVASTFRNLVAGHLNGRDPFPDDAAKRLVITLHKRGPFSFDGTVVTYNAAGERRDNRKFAANDCTELVETIALVVSLWLTPVVLPTAAPPKPPPEASPPPPEPPAPLPEPPEPRPERPQPPLVVVPAPADEPGRHRLVPRLGAGARADFGPAAGVLFGVTVEGGVQRQEWRWGGWSLMGAFRWAPQQTGIGPPVTAVAADVSSSLVAGRLAGCIYRAWPVSLAGCVVSELGAIQQSAGTPFLKGFHQTVLFAGGGVGARVKVPLFAGLYVQMETDVLGVGKLAGGTSMWGNLPARSFGGAAGGLGAGLGFSF
jgi:hypothetical protein